MSNTIIQLKYTTSTGNTPTSLEYGELAINLADGKLFYKNSSNTIDFIENFQGPSGLNGDVQFNDSGVLGSDSGFSYDKSNNILSIETVRLNSSTDLRSVSKTTTSTEEEVLFSFPVDVYSSGKFIVQASDNTNRQITEILVIHDGTDAYATEYAVIKTGESLFSLNVSIVSSNVLLTTESTDSNTISYKVFSSLLML
jgi:hypothetical protein